MSKVKIAVAQFEIAQYKPMENLLKAEQMIKNASGKADLIVFPEDFVTGPIEAKHALASKDEKYLRYFQNLADKFKIDIVPGSMIVEKEGKLYNTSYYIDNTGKVLGEYQKINLWHPERSHFEPGNKVRVFDTRFGKVGLAVCWDLIFPEPFRGMAKLGAEIIICPSYWCYGDSAPVNTVNPNAEIDGVDALCVARAYEDNVIMVYCNAAGNIQIGTYKDRLIGHSQITAPILGVIKKLDHNNEELFISEVDLNILKDSESVYKIREDLRKKND